MLIMPFSADITVAELVVHKVSSWL